MYNLYFRRSNGEKVFLAKEDTVEKCNKVINKDIYCRSNGKFEPPYYRYSYNGRTLDDSSEITVDVGSYTEFYIMEKEV